MTKVRQPLSSEHASRSSRALVVTTINPPNEALRTLARGALAREIPFFVVGDTKSPGDFCLPGVQFVSLQEQDARYPRLSRALPRSHYVRKNIGYVLALETRVSEIQESDDDNIPQTNFWASRSDDVEIVRTDSPWFNVYSLFIDELIWPRGFPLEYINQTHAITIEAKVSEAALIQQDLADGNPDVDAIFRLTRKLPITFKQRTAVFLPRGVWSPFNSQNTIFKRRAFPLLYLPSCCSFRMTDIWRSFVAQRCLWELNSGVSFHSPTVYQERNEHSLLRDFEDEVPGYLLNDKIRIALEAIALDSTDMLRSMSICYEALVSKKLVPSEELMILKEWERTVEKFL
jgi:hypothetical protein